MDTVTSLVRFTRYARPRQRPRYHCVTDSGYIWAAIRAEEGRREQPLVSDRYARLFADSGVPFPISAAFRSRVLATCSALEGLLERAWQCQQFDCVVNIGAGFDMRPFRLRLPAELNWVEVDLPSVTALKRRLIEALNRERTVPVQLKSVDITSKVSRRVLFAQLAARFKSVLVITEGLLECVGPALFSALVSELQASEVFKGVLLDYDEVLYPSLLARVCQRGWRLGAQRGLGQELSSRGHRYPGGILDSCLPEAWREYRANRTGVALLHREWQSCLTGEREAAPGEAHPPVRATSSDAGVCVDLSAGAGRSDAPLIPGTTFQFC